MLEMSKQLGLSLLSLLLVFWWIYYLRQIPCSASSDRNNSNVSRVTCENRCLNKDIPQLVSFHGSIRDGRQLGDQIFNLAAVLFVAELIDGIPVIQHSTYLGLEDVFETNLQRVSNLCPCYIIGEQKHLSYDIKMVDMNFCDPNVANKTIIVRGYRQSWKYTLGIERHLKRHLVFRDEIQRFAQSFIQQNIPVGWKRVGFARVGVHIHRGNNLSMLALNYGYTLPNRNYFFKAMEYFTDKYSRVQFIIVSDEATWSRLRIGIDGNASRAINITISSNNTSGQNLAILSMCDHVIMSTGTFGWWAAWLAKGTTIYYSDWPRAGSPLDHHFNREDFFPPFWIPMTS